MNTAAEFTRVRRVLAALFALGSLGTATELVLMEHTEGVWQNLPLVLIAGAGLAMPALAIWPGRAQLRSLQIVLSLFVVSGVAGILLHYRGNSEFERELNPDAAGIELFWQSMKGATPALAPGTMILLGALGFVYVRLNGRE